jgi:hypothetical protein
VDVLYSLQHYTTVNSLNPRTVAQDFTLTTEERLTPGRPPYKIPVEVLEDLRGLKFSWAKITMMLVVSSVLLCFLWYGIKWDSQH